MKKRILIGVLFASVSSHAAIPPAQTSCRFPRKVTNSEEVTAIPADQIQWNCLNVSALPKTDFLEVAAVAPTLTVRLSDSTLNKADFIEAQKNTKMNVQVNSRRFNRIDIQDLQRAGVDVSIQTFGLALTVPDYLEIAQTGPITLDINSKNFSKQQIMDFAKMENVRILIDPSSSGLSASEVQEILAAAPSADARPVQ